MPNVQDLYHEDQNGAEFVVGGSRPGDPDLVGVRLRYDSDDAAEVVLSTKKGPRSVRLVDVDGTELISIVAAQGNVISIRGQYGNGVYLDGTNADVVIGGTEQNGDLTIRNGGNTPTIVGEGGEGRLSLGAEGTGGVLRGASSDGRRVFLLNADGANATRAQFTLGGPDREGRISVKNADDNETIRIRGDSGDIEFFHADFAEYFDIAPALSDTVLPGTVMVMDQEGTLEPCSEAYATGVVGVVAGAGGLRPALMLDKKDRPHRQPIAMVGKAYCFVDATEVPVRRGDLLTTSPTQGHAMKATDPVRGFGSVIGKAMESLDGGQALVRTLIHLH